MIWIRQYIFRDVIEIASGIWYDLLPILHHPVYITTVISDTDIMYDFSNGFC